MVVSAFRRGFILDTKASECPEGFVKGPLLPGFFVADNTEVSAKSDRSSGAFIVVIGTCVSVGDDGQGVVEALLARLASDGEQGLFESMDNLVGRFAILYGDTECVKVAGDATCMRPIFYSADGTAIASHALLLAKRNGRRVVKSQLPFSSSFPANFTPYEGVRILPPNLVLKLGSPQLQRFWPRGPLPQISTEKAATQVLDLSVKGMKALSDGRETWAALTAGLDSRVLLAVCIAAGVNLKTFTYGNNAGTLIDRRVASHISELFDIPHFEVPTRRPEEAMKTALEEAHYWDHHWSAVEPLSEVIGNSEAAVFSANILELGQSNYRKLEWNAGLEEPKQATQMAAVYHRKLSRKAKDEVLRYRKDEYLSRVSKSFQELIDDGGRPSDWLDPFDEYYWSIRMGTWHGPSSVEKDFYGEPLNPFNSRAVIKPLLSVSKPDQYDLSVFLRLITKVDCRLLDIPINPPKWP